MSPSMLPIDDKFFGGDIFACVKVIFSKSLMSKMYDVTGDYADLWKKKDVQFDYLYDNFDAGKDVLSLIHI